MSEAQIHKNEERSYYPALRGKFGDWVFYSCLMSMQEVTQRLSFADEIHKSKKLSDWIQRQLKKGRSKEISDYLHREKQRFFNSLVVAIYGGDPAWHGFSNFRPQTKDIQLADVPSDVENSVGFLSFAGEEHIFAIDGQHRLAGMKEAIKKTPELGRDEVSLLLVAHATTNLGQERTRRLFTTLNKTAKPVGKGDIIALDENDVMAIATRYLVENDPWFSQERIKFSQTDNLPLNAPEFTTIGNLYDVLTTLFTKCGPDARSLAELRFVRPNDKILGEYMRLAKRYFRGLAARFPPLYKYFHVSPDRASRLVSRCRTAAGGHVLFRPVGLRIFVEITGILVHSGKTLDAALKLMEQLPVNLSEEPYVGVIWQTTGKMTPAGRTLCRRLLLYMLGHEKNATDLQIKYARVLGVATDQAKLPKVIAA